MSKYSLRVFVVNRLVIVVSRSEDIERARYVVATRVVLDKMFITVK